MAKKKTLSYQQKLSWLKKHNVTIKKKPSQSTVNRLYSFYQRNPLSTPVYFAYGMQKRLEQSIKKYGEDYELRAPSKTTTAKKYVKDLAKKRTALVKKKISYRASFSHSKYKRYMERVQDYIVYRPNITVNEMNINKQLENLRKNWLPVIKKDIWLIARNFNIFYKKVLIGSVSSFKSHDFPQGEGFNYQRVGFVRITRDELVDFFVDELFESFRRGFGIVYKYDNMSVTLFKIEIIFTSDERASLYEKLRVK